MNRLSLHGGGDDDDPKSLGDLFRCITFGRRCFSEACIFGNSYDHATLYAKGQKEPFDMTLDLLDTTDTLLDDQGRLLIPARSAESRAPSVSSSTRRSSRTSEEKAATSKPRRRPSQFKSGNSLMQQRSRAVSHQQTKAGLKVETGAPLQLLSSSDGKSPEFLKYFQNVFIDDSLKNQILDFVTEPQDMSSIRHLILSHEQFLNSDVMLGLLLNCFFEHSSESPSDQVMQARVLNILKKWCEISWPSLEFFKLAPILMDFLLFLHDTRSKYYPTLQATISSVHAVVKPVAPTPTTVELSYIERDAHYGFADANSMDLARQLTLIDWEFLRAVQLHELVQCRWIKDRAPTLFMASKRVNDLAYWIAFQVVTVNQLKRRIKVLIKIIRLAKHLLELRSFNSLMAIYLALNFPALARLTHTWENVGKKYLQQWKKISSVLSPVRNFKEYHDLTEDMLPPMIMCQEILLKDLLYHEQESQLIGKGAFDLRRISKIGGLIDQFRDTQRTKFHILKSTVMYNHLLQIPDWENSEIATDVLDGQSRHIEPAPG